MITGIARCAALTLLSVTGLFGGEARRAHLPQHKVIPAAKSNELTLGNGHPSYDGFAQWHRSNGDSTSSRFSVLDQIHRGNVKNLKVAWIYHSKDGEGNIQSNPIVVDGVLYAPTVGEHVVAIRADTGEELWRFKPEGRPAHRGLVYWKGDGKNAPRILFTAGRYLYALDPETGAPMAGFGERGKVPAGGVVAPAIYKHIIVVPVENEVKGFNVVTGDLLWTFHIIPREGEFGHEKWEQQPLGGNCWAGMAMDEQRGIAYVSTGSPHPNFIGVNHRGRNLFANSVIALRAETGRRLWHFQEIRHDIWDLDLPAPPNLVSITRGGRKFDAVAQVTKIGNTLLLDRVTGKPLFPFRLRRAPESELVGEETWPYQPDLELPEPFARQAFTREDVTDISPAARAFVLKQIAKASLGWFTPFEDGKPNVFFGIHGGAEWMGAAFDPTTGWLYVNSNHIPWIITVSRVRDAGQRDSEVPPTEGQKLYGTLCATCHGTKREGRAMAPPLETLTSRFDDMKLARVLKTGLNDMPSFAWLTTQELKDLLDYLFDRDLPASTGARAASTTERYTSDGYPRLLDHEGYPGSKPPWGTLNAIDLNTGRIAWRIPLGEHEELTRRGLPKTGTENFGGALVTAGGLVFCAGTRDLRIRAFDKTTGAELWQHRLPWGGYAAPATYQVNGRQYLVIAATGGGKLGGPMGDAYVAFTLSEGP